MTPQELAEKTTERTERRFRPFLEKIPLRDPPSERLIYSGMISDYYPFLGNKKMQVYVIKRDNADGRLGFGNLTSWGENRSVFNIYLDNSLFPGGQLDSPKLRKLVGVHEYVHCITAVMNLPKINTEPEQKDFKDKLRKKLNLEIISAQMIDKIMGKKGPEHIVHRTAGSRYYPDIVLFDDAHYRLDDDFSDIRYDELCDQLLFSKADFERYIGATNLSALKKRIKKNVAEEYKLILKQYKNTIAKEMDLYEDFVVRRIAEIIATYLWE